MAKKTDGKKTENKPNTGTGRVVKKGDIVKVDYKGMFEDGTVFDASEKHGAPLELTVGSGQVIPGFDRALIGMKLKETKRITILPADGYGELNPELMKKVPKSQLPAGLQKGMVMVIGLPSGAKIPATAVAVNDQEVTLDLNHPLAGKKLIFEITVVEIGK